MSLNATMRPSLHNCLKDKSDTFYNFGKTSAFDCIRGCNGNVPSLVALMVDLSISVADGPPANHLTFLNVYYVLA